MRFVYRVTFCCKGQALSQDSWLTASSLVRGLFCIVKLPCGQMALIAAIWLATVPGAKDSWLLPPTRIKFVNSLAICLEVLRRGIVFDSKSGAFE